MRWPDMLRLRLRTLFSRQRLEDELDEELRYHVHREMDAEVASGKSFNEARFSALRSIRNIEQRKEECRDMRGLNFIDSTSKDVQYAVRMLRRNLGFTTVACLSLALSIGANTAVFSAARQLLYERLAVPHAADLRLLTWTGPEQRVAVHHVHGDYDHLPGGLVTSPAFSYVAFEHFRAQNRVFDDLLAFRETHVDVTVRQNSRSALTEMVSGNYYAVLGITPQLGRALGPADDKPNSQPVVVISDEAWQRDFARSPNAIGQVVKVNDKPVTIVGVNPASFTGAKSILKSETPEITVTLAMQPVLTPSSDGTSWVSNPNQWWVNILGRIKPGVTDSAAQATLDTQVSAIVRSTMPVRKDDAIPRFVLRDGSRGLFEQEQIFAKPLSVLMLFVGLVLLLACANIANLTLARGAHRKREMSVRVALGAGRTRLLRQMLVESFLLAGLGGVLGLFLGYIGRLALPQLALNSWQKSPQPIHFDWLVFAFTACITIVTGLLFGFMPALAAARVEVNSGLKESALTATRHRHGLIGPALVGFQIALSTLLVIVAGLFIGTLVRLSAVNSGFNTHNLLLAQVPLPNNRYRAGSDITFHQRLEQSIAAIPGVDSVTAAMESYLSNDLSKTDFLPQGEPVRLEDAEAYNAVGTSFFSTLNIPILAGRAFDPQDGANSPKVGIINQRLARSRFPNQNPLGMMFSVGGHHTDGHGGKLTSDLVRIIGVCSDTLYTNLQETAPPQFFIPYQQQAEVGGMTYEIRTRVKPESILPSLRHAIQVIDPDVPLINVRTQDQQIEADLQQQRLFVVLTSGFGFLALVLATIGIYGVVAYSVAQRTNEIGIRLALGAIPRQVVILVLREASLITVVGVAIGIGASLLIMGFVRSLLYGVRAYDGPTFLGSACLLLIVSLVASWIPARRAVSVQPMNALRQE
ncbi:MAG: ABC transporter permease [Acidobacteriaceae bacterium]|nr:ABC transporter permease [Acidobacteriaceae bacterium]